MNNNTYKNFFRGVAWAASMRWAMRGIGFINVIILARLLTPEDFGIVAMATIIIGFISSFTSMGTHQLLIREQNSDSAMANTAWTMNIFQAIFLALGLLALGPGAANYFGDDRLVPIIYVLSLSCVIGGFYNIGVTLARKELDFALDFRANVYQRLGTFFTTLLLVIVLRDYWALVYGRLIGAIISVVISYLIHPYRPKLCVTYFRKYLKFSYAIIPLNISRALNEKLPSVIVGGGSSAATLGIFNIALDLAKLFTGEIAAPLGRGLMPNYAKLADDPKALAIAYAKVLSVASAIIIPVGVGLSLVAAQFVPLLLGSQWLEVVPFLQILSIYATLLSIMRLMSTQILIVSGYEARAAMLSWLRALTLAAAAVTAARFYGPMGVAMVCPLVALAMLPVAIFVLTKSLPISLGEVIQALWRPVFSGLAMTAGLLLIGPAELSATIGSLLVLVFLGGFIYVAVMAATWYISGKPEGLEYLVQKLITEKLASAASNQ
jgi:lipopolysaccharide exporter